MALPQFSCALSSNLLPYDEGRTLPSPDNVGDLPGCRRINRPCRPPMATDPTFQRMSRLAAISMMGSIRHRERPAKRAVCVVRVYRCAQISPVDQTGHAGVDTKQHHIAG